MTWRRSIATFVLASIIAPAQTVKGLEDSVLADDTTNFPIIGTKLDYFEDESGALDVRSIASPANASRFRAAPEKALNLGFSRSTYWLRFRVHNASTAATQWFLTIDWPMIDTVDLYRPRSDATFETNSAGTLIPFQEWSVSYRKPTFAIEVARGAKQLFYLRIQSLSTLKLPLILRSADALAKQRREENYWSGFALGATAFIALYHLALFLFLRDRLYLSYVMTVVLFGAYWFAREGHAAATLWPNAPKLVTNGMPILGALFLVFAAIFSRQFLGTGHHVPRADGLVRVAQWSMAILALFPLFGERYIFQQVIMIPGLSAALIIFACTFYVWRLGFRSAGYYVLGWFGWMLLGFAYGLDGHGRNPTTMDPNSLSMGFLLTTFTLSLALADRVSNLESKTRDAIHETASLQNQLSHALRVSSLGEMSTAIAHELSQPLSAIVNFTNAAKRFLQGQEHPDKVEEILTEIGDEAVRAGEVVQRIREFSRNRSQDRETIDIHDVIQEAVAVASLETNRRQPRIEVEFDRTLPRLSADRVLLAQVVLNLLRNACDALDDVESSRRVVRIQTKRCADSHMRISIADNGPGIPDELGDNLFEAFVTGKRHGIGMGLSISRQIVESHGGSLNVATTSSRGTTFHIDLPILPAEHPPSSRRGHGTRHE